MDDVEFQTRAAALGLTSKALPAARDVLVKGRSINGAARAHGLDPGHVNRTCKRIERASFCGKCGQEIARK